MTVRMKWMPGLWIACLLVTSASCFGQASPTTSTQQRAENLSGVVYSADADGTKHVMSDVIVAECLSGFRNCVMETKTDAEGQFSVSSKQNTRVHYLQFLSPGWSESQVTVRLTKDAGRLSVTLVARY
ncbi:hypothetical protein [Granulicella sp. S156]|jgi:hypothetical protein|uniref:hypothetical protein n=1 Tax=Granulicella sp. S156 TaxID=1747224 RepID=UPI00131C27A5|nr:hypothetical protein [Granulicella sp. S156]